MLPLVDGLPRALAVRRSRDGTTTTAARARSGPGGLGDRLMELPDKTRLRSRNSAGLRSIATELLDAVVDLSDTLINPPLWSTLRVAPRACGGGTAGRGGRCPRSLMARADKDLEVMAVIGSAA
jgi:hypothetical protein